MTESLLPDGLARILPPSATVGPTGHLEVGGCDLVAVAGEFGTPLYVYDADGMRARAREYREAFSGLPVAGQVVYASKACPIAQVVRLMAEAGLWVDVSTLGELEVARRADVDPATVVVHGNNKSDVELDAALDLGAGRIVIDSLDEIDRLAARVRARSGTPQAVYLRLTPGVDVETHEYIRTGQEDSKFGLGIADGQALAAVDAISRTRELDLVGVHAHIGSQIFDMAGYVRTADAALRIAAEAARRHGTLIAEMDLGGGLGIAYRPDETPIPVTDLAHTLGKSVAEHAAAAGLDGIRLLVEPGRSLVGRAGVTLYTVGVVKESAGRRYVAVDGGMSDNMRPALYGATYETLLAGDPTASRDAVADVVGKHCESGDVIAQGARLPRSVSRGDILVTPATGAYGWTMANNYNMLTRPAVVFVAAGDAWEVVHRETVDDLLRLMEA